MEKLISRKEAAKLLGISIATLDAARNSGLISYVQYVQNGCVYFTDAGLQEYIAKCTHRAKPVEKSATYRKLRRCPSLSCSVSLLEPNMSDKTKVQRWTLFLGGDGIGQKEKGQFLNMVRSCLTALNIIEPESKIRMETEWRFMQRRPKSFMDKELEALEQIDSTTFRRRSALRLLEYCEKWLLMQSVPCSGHHLDRLYL